VKLSQIYHLVKDVIIGLVICNSQGNIIVTKGAIHMSVILLLAIISIAEIPRSVNNILDGLMDKHDDDDDLSCMIGDRNENKKI
jgi:hypothetical protein